MSWDRYDIEKSKGPMSYAWRLILAVAGISAMIWVVSIVFGTAGEAVKVAHDEFGPKAMLDKYSWFKDASAALDQKQATIEVYKRRMTSLKQMYDGQPRQKWAREDREQVNIWESECAGVRASYNQLAGEYNAEMAKFNWRFANVGDLPAGATKPVQREYKLYIEE